MSLIDGKHGVSQVSGSPNLGGGVDLGSAVVIPPGGQVFYVRGDGTSVKVYDYDPPGLPDRLIASVAKALTYCTASRGDVVIVLPGHTESIAAADSWPVVVGVKIIGLGSGTRRPTITWTVAASTVLLSKAGVTIENMILNLEPGTGGVAVTAPITISAAGCTLRNNQILVQTDSANYATIGITTTAAADDLSIIGNEIYGITGTSTNPTTCIDFIGCDRLKFCNNTVFAASNSTSVGVVRFATTANTSIVFDNNRIVNNKAASVTAVTGTTSETGFVSNTILCCAATTATTIVGGTAWSNGTASGLYFGPNVVAVNGTGKTGAAFGVAAS